MSSEQYRVGYSSVTPGAAIVSGYGTLWSSSVLAADVYKPDIDAQPTAVIGSVDSNTQLTLASNWAGTTITYKKYMIQRSFSVNKNLARPYQGDADLADLLREQVIDKIDTEMQNPTFTEASAVTYVTSPSGTTITNGQIGFPASQVASADPNTLDDYEEGSYITALTCGTSGNITLRSAFDSLGYTKIGRVVHVHGQIIVSSVTAPVGPLRVNLPFAAATLSEGLNVFSGAIIPSNINAIGTGGALGIVNSGGATYATILEMITTGYSNDVSDHIVATSELYLSLTYVTA